MPLNSMLGNVQQGIYIFHGSRHDVAPESAIRQCAGRARVQQGRHPVADSSVGWVHGEQAHAAVHMRMEVDESGRYEEPVGLEDLVPGRGEVRSYLGYEAVTQADVQHGRGSAGAVDNRAATEQGVA